MRHPAVQPDEPEKYTACENLPPLLSNRDQIRKSKRRRSSSSEESLRDPVKELVKEDLYLMENKVQRVNTNLLANSLAVRLRQSIPENVNVGQTAMNKLRRDSLKDLVYLDNLNRKYTNEMNWESNRLDKESFQLIKRHNNMKKQSEHQQKNQEKLEAQMRTRSGFSSVSLLPRLVDSVASTIEPHEKIKEKLSSFAFVDKEDSSFVKVFKLNGVFQPQNKYGSRNDLYWLPPKTKKNGTGSQDLTIIDSDSPIDLPFKSKSRKGLSVTWSSQSQFYSNDVVSGIDSRTTSRTDTRADTVSTSLSREEKGATPNNLKSLRSVRSDSVMWKKPKYTKGRSKVDAIGLKWQVSKDSKKEKLPQQLGRQSRGRNLVPVTTALDREGMSPTRMKWHVHPIQSPSAMDSYVDWIEKLDDLKRAPTALSKSPDMKPKQTREMPVVSVPV